VQKEEGTHVVVDGLGRQYSGACGGEVDWKLEFYFIFLSGQARPQPSLTPETAFRAVKQLKKVLSNIKTADFSIPLNNNHKPRSGGPHECGARAHKNHHVTSKKTHHPNTSSLEKLGNVLFTIHPRSHQHSV
jgi:hypothetical protein